MIAYDIVKEPTGIDYTCFIDSACDLSDAVMMVFCVRQGSKQQHSVMKETRHKLALWRIKSRHNPEWPITKSFDDRVAFTIDLYRPSQEVREYLYTAQRLYGWIGEGGAEDICFFRNNHCWMATCSHEEFGWIETDIPIPSILLPYVELIHEPNIINYIETYST